MADVSDVSEETAYYFNAKAPAVALIGKGVRFPAGRWMRIADGNAVAWHVEKVLDEMFPALRGRVLPFVTLLSEFEVKEFDRPGLEGTPSRP